MVRYARWFSVGFTTSANAAHPRTAQHVAFHPAGTYSRKKPGSWQISLTFPASTDTWTFTSIHRHRHEYHTYVYVYTYIYIYTCVYIYVYVRKHGHLSLTDPFERCEYCYECCDFLIRSWLFFPAVHFLNTSGTT